MSLGWYILYAYSGSERKIAASIREEVISRGLENIIHEVIVPTEESVEIRRGKRVVIEKPYLPGYILVKMDLNDDSRHLIKSMVKVSSFLGASGKPVQISDSEVQRILNRSADSSKIIESSLCFEIGEQVKVADGPFTSFNGVVEEVDYDKSRLKVAVSIFGRSTPVDLDFSQVDKF